MKIIAGLGNPGKKYQETRHNIGFWAVDYIARENNFPDFKLSKKFEALISEKEKVILSRPQTFMNNSGRSIKALLKYYKTDPSSLTVIHDDIDLKIGEVKIVQQRGSAGHKGVESIIENLKTKDFARIRIGIQPKEGKPQNTESFVLQKFSKEEQKAVKESIKAFLTHFPL